MKLSIEDALNRGIEAHKAGNISEASQCYHAILKVQPKHPDANHNLGILTFKAGKIDAALPLFKTALEASPSIDQFWLSYIESLLRLGDYRGAERCLEQARQQGKKGEMFDQFEQWLAQHVTRADTLQDPPNEDVQQVINSYHSGQLQNALDQANQLLEAFPESTTLLSILGVVQAALGLTDDAIQSYQQAIESRPDHATYNNLGVALKNKGEYAAAIECFEKALHLVANYPEARSNLGSTYKDMRNLDAAIEQFNIAIKLKPDYADAYNNLGNALMEQARLDEAINNYTLAIQASPDYAQAFVNLGLALQDMVFTRHKPELHAVLCELLDKQNLARPGDISKAVVSLLKCDPVISEILNKNTDGNLSQPVEEITQRLASRPLLIKIMSICPIPDPALEQLLTGIRSTLLQASSSSEQKASEALEFQTALALQCFVNEYVYIQSQLETGAIAQLESSIEHSLNVGHQPEVPLVLTLASYKPLHSCSWHQQLEHSRLPQALVLRQLIEPHEEGKIRADIPVLANISNSVSSAVRDQYEDNPYPRWVNTGLRLNAATTAEIVKDFELRLIDNTVLDSLKPSILVAGCGTGQHSTGTATRFKDSNVVAVDLSMASLAYAKRKTRELGIKNIQYLQADILDLQELNQQFDIVESVGVLHHMHNPMDGWRNLTKCLKPGGLMRIGLYSEAARQAVVKIREETMTAGKCPDKEEMKALRVEMMNSELDHHLTVTSSQDFYTLSALRDLLFHVQEHRFTLAQIETCLDELGLEFCGFEMKALKHDFRLTNQAPADAYDLKKWAVYEDLNPGAFAGMYQFWCQKRSNSDFN